MTRRPLVLVSVVFVLILSVFNFFGNSFISHHPVNTAEDGAKILCGYLQDDVIELYGVISDYSFQDSFSGRTTKLILRDVSVLEQSKQYKKITRPGQSVLIYLNKEETHAIGNTVLVSGKLSFFEPATNPGQFNAEKYYGNRDVLFAVEKASVIRELTGSGLVIEKAAQNTDGMKSKGSLGLRQRLKKLAFAQEEVLEAYFSSGNAAIMKAMLLGNKTELDKETKQLYQDNGIAHILAISGLHISLLGMSVYKLLRCLPLPVWMPLILSEIFLLLYGCMVGFPVSAVRAVGMFSFFLISKLLKRSYDMLSALAFMAMLQLIQHPGYLSDCGFQLSYGAILGIGVLLPIFEEINKSISCSWLRKGISFLLPSLSVTLVTTPILIYHYHEVSVFSILLNVIVLPFMGVLLISGISVLFFAQFFSPLAKLAAFIAGVILCFYEYSCRFLELFPIGQKNLSTPSVIRLIMCFMLFLVLTALVKRKSHPYQFAFVVLLIGLLSFPQNPQFRLWITDIGQGDASVILTKERKCFVIDCGSTTKYKAGEKILIPLLKYHGVDNVDAVFVTHADADHMNGVLELLELGAEENIQVERIVLYEKTLENEPDKWEDLLVMAKQCGADVVGMAQGDKVQTDTVTLECLYPLREQNGLTGNASSLVLSLEAEIGTGGYTVSCFASRKKGKILEGSLIRGESGTVLKEIEGKSFDGTEGVALNGKKGDGIFRALFTGDLEADGEAVFLEKYFKESSQKIWGDYDFLKVGHHGSSGSSSAEFLEWVSPRLAVISCGKDNMYGHPHKETLERLETAGIQYLITYEEGAVMVE